MNCIDESFEIFGNYDSNSGSNLMVVFEICDPDKRKCKTEAEISELLKFKYIQIVKNNMNYNHEEDHNKSEHLEKFSITSWHPLSY